MSLRFLRLQPALGGAGGISINYLIHDRFTTDVAAGSLDGTSATPGPGERNATDGGNRMSVSGNKLITDSGGTYNDPTLHWGAVTKSVGLAYGVTISQSVDASEALTANLGWDNNNLTDLREGRFLLSSGDIRARDGSQFSSTYNVDIGDYVRLTDYNLAFIILDTLIVFCAKGGTYTDWTMLHKIARASELPSTIYPGVNSYGRQSVIKELSVAPLPTWSDGDSIVSSLSDGDPITGGLQSALDAFFTISV